MIGRARRLAIACGLFCIGVACGEPEPVARAQLLLVVATDAPIPRAGLTADDVVLFDRLRIAVYRNGEDAPCAGCVRDFVLATDRADRAISAGIARESDEAVAFVALYAERNRDRFGAPDAGSALSAWIHLPVPSEHEVRPLQVTLTMNDLGRPLGSRDAPIETNAAPPMPLARWAGARRAPCAASPRADEACVPGGVVWMGSALRSPGASAGLPPRLVSLSPFLVDVHEVTVADFRASALAEDHGPGTDSDPAHDTGSAVCTYSPLPGPDEGLPVTCITHYLARTYCRARGKDLPTEAQYEYLQGGLRGARYPWGDDDPSCTDAVFGRDRERLGPCGLSGFGPRLPGSGARDVLVLGGIGVTDLAGNVSEWARERHADEDAPCHAPGHHLDPVCEGSGMFVARGGAFVDPPLGLRSEVRFPSPSHNEVIGFRCVRAIE